MTSIMLSISADGNLFLINTKSIINKADVVEASNILRYRCATLKLGQSTLVMELFGITKVLLLASSIQRIPTSKF